MSDLSVLEVQDQLRKFAGIGHDIVSKPGRITGFGRTNTHSGALIHFLSMSDPILTTYLGNESGALTKVSSLHDPDLRSHWASRLHPVLRSSRGWEVEPSDYDLDATDDAESMEELAPHIHKIRSSGITPIFRNTKDNSDTPTPLRQLQAKGFHMPTGLGEHAIKWHGIITDTRDFISTLEPHSFGGHLVIVGHTKGDVYSDYMYNLHDEKLNHIAEFES